MKKFLLSALALLAGVSANADIAEKPVANDDISRNNAVGSQVMIDILANDLLSTGAVSVSQIAVDLDASSPGYQLVLPVPGEGAWLLSPDGTFLAFFAEPGFTGDPTPITYTLTENLTGLSDQATVTVLYLREAAPVDDIYYLEPGTPIELSILNNDFLINGTTPGPGDVIVDIDPATPEVQSDLTVPGEGQWIYDPASGILGFSALFGFTNAPTPISYTITDNAERVSDPGMVTVHYVNKPVANDDVSSNNAVGSQVPVQILNNDLSGSGDPIVPSTVTVDIDAATPGNQQNLIIPGKYGWIYEPSGLLTLVSWPDFIGDPAPITYTLTDNVTGMSDQATVTVDYLNNPTANDDVSGSNARGVPVSIPILDNDLLFNGTIPGSGTLIDIDPATPGTQITLTIPSEGQWNYNGSILTFTPLLGFMGAVTPITYTLFVSATEVSNPATVTIEFLGPPTATDDISSGNTLGAPTDVAILANDLASTGNPVSKSSVIVDLDPFTPDWQTTLTVPGEGAWSFNAGSGILTFTPEPGVIRDPTPLSYTLTDFASALSDQAMVTIGYLRVLTATSDVSIDHIPGIPSTVSILDNDVFVTGATPAPTDVSVDLDLSAPGVQPGLNVPGEGTWAYDPSTGVLTFSPEANLAAAPTPISYILTDIANDVSDPATVTVTYVSKPVVMDDISNRNIQGSDAVVLFLVNDMLSSGSASSTMVTIDIDTSTPGNQSTLTVPGEGVWTYDGIFVITFSPEPGFAGDPAPITYTLTENATGLSDQATVTVQFLSPPVAYARDITIPAPAIDLILPLDGLNGHPLPLSATDRQDGSMGAGSTFVLNNSNGLNGNKLLYNNVPVSGNSIRISGYNPSMLAVKFTGVGSTALSFNYQVTDSQGLSSEEVTYKLSWETPLPVTLISFDAKAEGSNQVMLSWATSEESNSDYFEVQRSGDGVNWQALGLIPAAGLSSTVQQYTFRDEHPLAGQNLFRLKMVDTDNSYAYSQVRYAQVRGGGEITMSPNPVSDLLTVHLPAWKEVSALTIVDQSGRKRGSAQPAAKAVIDMRKFEPGIYLVVIDYRSGASQSRRIVVK